jgi:hypothetical protein
MAIFNQRSCNSLFKLLEMPKFQLIPKIVNTSANPQRKIFKAKSNSLMLVIYEIFIKMNIKLVNLNFVVIQLNFSQADHSFHLVKTLDTLNPKYLGVLKPHDGRQ